MTTREEELLAEIESLKRKLDVSTRWMKRQVQESIQSVAKDRVKKINRYKFQNELEREQLVLLESSIEDYFGTVLLSAPPKTVERLIDAELQWYTLQKYPQMDALALTLAYQKIFDACIEQYLSEPFRQYARKQKILMRTKYEDPALEKDLENVLYKWYNLSSGRLYQLIEVLKKWPPLTQFVWVFQDFLEHTNTHLASLLISDEFMTPFRSIIEMEIFSKKRHESKVSYIDGKNTRSIMVGNLQAKNSILYQLFEANHLV